MEISFFKVNPLAKDPVKATPGSAAFDIYSPMEFSLYPNERKMIDTGIIFNIPPGWSGLLFARSGLAAKKGVCLSTGVSLIDSDFRETLKVPLFYSGPPEQVVVIGADIVAPSITLNAGDRIAQIVFLKLDQVGLIPTTVRETTDRGGFGSTGA
jgi:dUTP pyrophosphatase